MVYLFLAVSANDTGQATRSARDAEALDLPFELDAASLLHPRPHGLAKLLEIGPTRLPLIDEEVAVHLRDLGVADREPAAAGGINELPGFVPRRVLEGRAAGAALDRLRLLAIGGDAVHLSENLRGLACLALEQSFGEDKVLGRAAMAILVVEVCHWKHVDLTFAVDGARFDHNLAGLAAMRASVHAQRAPGAAWDAAIEGEAGDARSSCGAGDLHVGHRSADAEAMALLDLDVAEATPQADHYALDAAVAHQQIRAEPDHGDRNIGRRLAQEIGEVAFVSGRIEDFGGAACPEPSEIGESSFGFQLAAQIGQACHELSDESLAVHDWLLVWSRLGSAFIQSVMVPAPSPTTRSPFFATEATVSTKVSSSSTVSTCGWPCRRKPDASSSRSMPGIGASPAE